MNIISKNNHLTKTIILIVFIKLLFALFFTSEYKQLFFISFVEHFILNLDNTYEYFFNTNVEFPYPPLMLYILSLFHMPYVFLFDDNIILENLFFKIPIFIADITILYLLFYLFPSNKKNTIFFYFLNPIILYSSYMHSQLDIIPMACVFLSAVLLLKNKYIASAIIIGLAISIKFHTVIAIPLMIIYIIKYMNIKSAVVFITIPIGIYLFFAFPYLMSDAYLDMVLFNDKQSLIFDSFHKIGTLKVYLPIIGILMIYAMFFKNKKINQDLLFSFLGLLFSVFILFVFPAPAWYVWFIPFLSVFFINYDRDDKNNIYFYFALNIAYILYFVFFYPSQLHDLMFLNTIIDLKIADEQMGNLFYTLLEAVVIINIYIFYKQANYSNKIYKNKQVLTFGIGGDSAVGKSTILQDMKSIFKNKLLDLEGDSEHKWERGDENWNQYTHLNPKANYIHKQAKDILTLKEGKSIKIKEYNHENGKFSNDYIVESKPYVVLSGLHPFYLPKMRKIIDIKVYMDTDESLRKHWKIIRDTQQRGYTQAKILEQIESRKMDTIKYIYPQKNYADLIVKYFTDDRFVVGNANSTPNLKLKLIFNADIHIEEFINILQENSIEIEWDYLEDLKRQYIIIHQEPNHDIQWKYIYNHIPNINELIDFDIKWLPGYRGVIQLLILEIVSNLLKEKATYEI